MRLHPETTSTPTPLTNFNTLLPPLLSKAHQCRPCSLVMMKRDWVAFGGGRMDVRAGEGVWWQFSPWEMYFVSPLTSRMAKSINDRQGAEAVEQVLTVNEVLLPWVITFVWQHPEKERTRLQAIKKIMIAFLLGYCSSGFFATHRPATRTERRHWWTPFSPPLSPRKINY